MTDASVKNMDQTSCDEPSSDSKRRVVLVVEEESAIRELLFYALQEYGFTVHLARNGPEAVDLFTTVQWQVDVVLMDWGMDGMNGPQTLEALREMNPRLPCCFMSGGASGLSYQDVRILAKPFTMDAVMKELLSLVH